MRTETVNVLKFAELSDEAKETARNWMRECITVEDWSDHIVNEDAASVGIKITGWDIGRGNSIDGTIDDTEGTAHQIVKNHGDECDTYKTAAAYLKERDELIDTFKEGADEDYTDEKLDELGEEFSRAILEDYLSMLRKEYEYAYSDEAIDENIEANEYDFDEDGERWTK